jgi:hypothetical protein
MIKIPTLFCPTPRAILLLALVGRDGVIRFPFARSAEPGFAVEVTPRVSVVPQLLAAVQASCRELREGFSVEVITGFSSLLAGAQMETTLYLARSNDPLLAAYFAALPHQATMPELLQHMAKDKKRVAYLLAWQTLLGVGEEQLYAVTREEVRQLLD